MTTYTPALDALLNHTDACSTDPYRDDDIHDDALTLARDLLIDENPYQPNMTQLHARLYEALNDAPRDALSTLALDMSLCPLHMIDYAACFDDDDPECAAIRSCFPSHDT
jgi:hypothetical protein